MLLGVDVGGTFTDAVVVAGDRLHTAKAPTTPDDQSLGVMHAVTAALERAEAAPDQVAAFDHGMTVATNALLEGRGARTALAATEGFTDLVALGRQARADLYRLCAAHPPPLVEADLRFGVPERTGPDGPLKPLEDTALDDLCTAVEAAHVEAVAVVLLHSYRHPEHERRLRRALRGRLGDDVHVSLSHELVGTFREYERAATTEVDAALSPLLAGYLRRLAARARDNGLPDPAIMQSSGGLADLELAAGHAALTVLSGPAAGAAGAAFAARAGGEPDVLCLDMGGTSCDVCVVDGGRVRETSGREVAGRPLALPMLDVQTVGAGGGSIAWRDAGGALRVGPRSAGAEPGPACYGRGGDRPTVTDADLLLGHLDQGTRLAGNVELHRELAERAVGDLAAELGLEIEECALGIARVVAVEMARALRLVTVERGLDPRDYTLLGFGGAGPMHAVAVAEELGMSRVLCPATSGVLAALGLVVGERRRDAQRSLLAGGEELRDEVVQQAWGQLAERARTALGDERAPLRGVFELRYRGQAFELAVEREGHPPSANELRAAFAAAHEGRYGYRDASGEVELVTLRVVAARPAPDLDLESQSVSDGAAREPSGRRTVAFLGGRREAAVWAGMPAAGIDVAGPAVCALPEATLVIPPGWSATSTPTAALRLEREPR